MYERLAGRTVILTREPPDNAELASRLREHALQIVELPCVRTEPLGDPSELCAALAALREEDWVVVTSRHGADGIARCGPTRARLAAIGAATADRLRSHGLDVAFQPSLPHGAALARELPMRSGTVLLARSDRALPDLPRILRERGFDVREIVAYRTIAEARGYLARVRAMLASAQPAAVLFHSPSAVEGMLGAIEPALVARASIHVFGGSTLRAVREALGASADVSLIEEEAVHVAHR
jgi:uroporphyrinogen-III synthase